jgi:hypothetical protein
LFIDSFENGWSRWAGWIYRELGIWTGRDKMGSWSGVVVAAWWRDLTTGEGKKLQDSRSEQEEFTFFLGM